MAGLRFNPLPRGESVKGPSVFWSSSRSSQSPIYVGIAGFPIRLQHLTTADKSGRQSWTTMAYPVCRDHEPRTDGPCGQVAYRADLLCRRTSKENTTAATYQLRSNPWDAVGYFRGLCGRRGMGAAWPNASKPFLHHLKQNQPCPTALPFTVELTFALGEGEGASDRSPDS